MRDPVRASRVRCSRLIWGRRLRSVHWIIACVRGFVVPAVAPLRSPVAVRENTEHNWIGLT